MFLENVKIVAIGMRVLKAITVRVVPIIKKKGNNIYENYS